MVSRLAWRGIGPASVLAALFAVFSLPAQPPQNNVTPSQPMDPNMDLAGVALPRNNRLESQVQAAQEYSQSKNWQEATSILQKLLELPEDVFVLRSRTTADGKRADVMVSIRQEADRMVAALPKEGKEFYQLNYGALAAGFLKEAKEKASPELLGRILRIYLHTQAGAEAAVLLGTYQLDRGNYFAASLCFDRLIERSGIESVSPVALARAGLAFQLSGDTASRDKVFSQLRLRGIREVPIVGNTIVSIDDWRAQVAKMSRPSDAGVSDWALVGGSPKRTASAQGGTAFLEPLWRKSTVRESDSKALLLQSQSALLDRMSPLVPGMIPLAEKAMIQGKPVDLVVYRSSWGVHAVNLKTGELEWESPNEWSVDGMSNPRRLDISRRKQAVSEWVATYLNMGARAGVPLENTTVGTLASDGQRVYAINDLQVPPPVMNVGYGMPFDPSSGGGFGRYGPEISDAIQSNRIRAYDLANGKLKWETGGRGDLGLAPGAATLTAASAANLAEGQAGFIDLSESHFLGAPLPIGGRLYVLNEKQQEIRLLTLDPETGKVLSAQTLVTTRDRLVMDTLRRSMAAHLAYGDGILVCPTNAGAILGVDMLTGSLVWSYLYRETGDGQADVVEGGVRRRRPVQIQVMPGMPTSGTPNSFWRSAPPMVAGDRVVFTSPYAKSLFCLDLRTGVKVWSQQRSDEDLYLGGVYQGKVIVVGKRSVRGIDLSTGQTSWTVETGSPSGYGTASGNLYFLPLRESVRSRDPEICTIDITTGKVVAHTRSRKKEIPGNLVFHGGEVVSQGAMDLGAFPQLAVKLAQIDEKIRLNPADPEGLADRGELRLDKGDFAGAIADLDTSLGNNPAATVRAKAGEKLFEAFTEAFQEDFVKWESMLPRFEQVCKVDGVSADAKAEERRRQSTYFGLLARGREKQGRLLDAVKAYESLANVVDPGMFFIPTDDSALRISADVLSRGRLMSMLSSAKSEDKAVLESWLASRLAELTTKPDDKTQAAKLNAFAIAFGGLFDAGRTASMDLAKPAVDPASPLDLVQAERLLEGARAGAWPANQAALGLDLEARIYAARQLVPDAAQTLTYAASRYPDALVRPGITTRRVLDELAADKRFLPFMAEPSAIAPNGPIKVIEERSNNVPRLAVLHPVIRQGSAPVWFDRHQFHLQNTNQSGNLTLKVTSQASGETWDLALGGPSMHQFLMQGTAPGTKRQPFVYQTSGHLMILWIANMVHGIDPIRRKLLWEVNLAAGKTSSTAGSGSGANFPVVRGGGGGMGRPVNMGSGNFMIDPVDGMLVQVREDGWKQRVGMAGPILDGVVTLLGRDGLSGHDILTGRVLWTRTDIKTDHLIVGQDAGVIFLVQTNTDGTPAGSRAVRVMDGAVVPATDFSQAYRNRLLISGSRILAHIPEKPADKNQNSLAVSSKLVVVDMNGGKEILSRNLPMGTRAMVTDLGDLAGLIGLQGEVEIVSLPDGKTVHKVMVEPTHVEKTQVHLVADNTRIYLVPNKPSEQLLGGIQTNFMGQLMLRLLPANGDVYAFDRQTGKLAWRNTLVNQLMILDRFEELPMVIFTSRFNRLVNIANARSVVATVGLKGYDKRTGKLIVDKDMGQQSQPFHGFVVDVRQGRLDLMDYQNKISFLWGPGLALAEGAKSASLPAVASGSPSSMGNDPANNPGLPAMIFGINGPGPIVRPANANRPAVPKPNGPGRAFPAPNMPLVPPTQTVPAAPKP